MRKYLWLAIAGTSFSIHTIAQDSSIVKSPDTITVKKKKDWSKVSLANRANDHFMIQTGYDTWLGESDSLHFTGFSRHFNFYVMYDKPFQSNPRLSVAAGIGVSSSGIFFDKTVIDIAGKNGSNSIEFTRTLDAKHYKKYKLANTWIEVPLELRFVTDPLHSGRSFKVALGGKFGLLVDAHTKGKNLVAGDNDASLYGTKYIEKEKSKKYFNTTRFSGTLRVGYGAFTVFTAYQLNTLFKENAGPAVHPYSIGLCISGL